MAEIIILVAVAQNGVIGKGGKLPWHLPSDLQHFKKTTMKFPLIMGRKTFESIGKALPGRENIVLTRDTSRTFPGCKTMHTIQAAIDHCRNNEKAFIIGGGVIFNEALPFTDTIILTALAREVDGDVYFPEIDTRCFHITDRQSFQLEEPYEIIRYERIATDQ